MHPFLPKDDDRVHAGQSGQYGGALAGRDERAVRAFELADRRVGVEANDEPVAEAPGALEVAHMAEVEQVEAAVRGDNPLTVTPGGVRPTPGLREVEEFWGTGIWA